MSLGLRQADLAEMVGISASYLNLIEHNRRRIAEPLLDRLAAALGQEPASYQDGVAATVLEDLRAAVARAPGGELARVEDFAGRFPGWAKTLTALHQRVVGLERALEAVNDRMSHDPHLSASLHEILSVVSSLHSTAAILADTDDIEPEWQNRFLTNLQVDSKRLALGAEALVRYLDSSGHAEEQGLASPQEEVETWLAASDWQPGDVAELASSAAREMASSWIGRFEADRHLLPEAILTEAVAEFAGDPFRIAARFGCDVLTVFRRIALRPGAEAGLVVCDASGTLTFRKPIAGFALPRFGAACPLWPLFSALARPMMPLEMQIEAASPEAAQFRVLAFCQPRYPMGAVGPELREAAMLILPDHAPPVQPLRIGSTCRICQQETCPARREPSILSA